SGGGGNSLEDSIVGRGVACMQSDEHVYAGHVKAVDRTDPEVQSVKARGARDAAAKLDQLAARVDAGHFYVEAANVLKIVVGGKCQIAFAAAHVDYSQARSIF